MITVQAPAKINLGLKIIGKRPDGFHDIETVFHRINLYDELTFELSDKISISCVGADLPTDDRNLCVRAAKMLGELCHTKQGVAITLKKNIPIGAGLGGGSSDAAATLLALVRLWGIEASAPDLLRIAVQLGSDVPYFLNPGDAYATGRGEKLEYFELRLPYWIVVVYPNVQISTAWAYANAIPSGKFAAPTLKETLQKYLHDPGKLSAMLPNDFEQLVFDSYPVVSEVKNVLETSGALFTRLSGSGSSVYGLYADETPARVAAASFQGRYPVFVSPPS
jgi:4-diphosphocytidyl-2-C-methyl-D-erythritol kinase